MLLNPGILALVGNSILLCAVTTAALACGLGLMVGWNPDDSGASQLRRERRALLVEATLGTVLWLELISLFLFVSIVDRIHPLLTGAMCAAGTLNANPFGYPALWAKTATFGICGLWLIFNRASCCATSIGLVRCKQLFMVLIWVSLLVESGLQIRFFSGLEPEVLTSCCASVFDDGGAGLGSNLATVPVSVSVGVLSILLPTTLTTGWLVRIRHMSAFFFSIVSSLTGIACAVAVVTWVAPSYYQLPTHHCPFCLLTPGVGWVGYPLLGSLCIAIITGIGAGFITGARSFDPMNSIRPNEEIRLCSISMAAFTVFSALAVWPTMSPGLRLGVI